MSHAAATFILQKSNEMLSMFKALKRKPNSKNSNHTTNTVTTTQCDGSKSSVSQSKRITAVNCMNSRLSLNDDESVSLSNNSDASNCNIYTEIKLHDDLSTKDLETQPIPTDSNESTLSSDILRFLFNDINSLHNSACNHDQSETKHVNCYVNESVTSHGIAQMEAKMHSGENTTEQNLYDIDRGTPNDSHKVAFRQESEQMNETTESATVSESSAQSNVFIAGVSKSFKQKLKFMVRDSESLPGVLAKSASESELTNSVGGDKASFRKRFKVKFKAGLQFFKDAKVRYLAAHE